LSDAGKVAYHGVRLAREFLRPGGAAMVVGVGGLGHLAVQILNLMGSRVVAVDISDDKLRHARDCGAVAAVRSDQIDDPAALVAAAKDAAGGSVDAAFDYVSLDQTLALCAGAVRSGGMVVVNGTGAGTPPLGHGRQPVKGVTWIFND